MCAFQRWNKHGKGPIIILKNVKKKKEKLFLFSLPGQCVNDEWAEGGEGPAELDVRRPRGQE